MKIELHILQNFAPTNLNRDDTGAPKDCELGGYRRARISSQCLKRAAREAFEVSGFAKAEMAIRTKRIAEEIADALMRRQGLEPSDSARSVELELACFAIESLGFGFERKEGEDEDLKSEYLLFLPTKHVERFADLIHLNRIELTEAARGTLPAGRRDKPSKDAKKKNRARLPKVLRSQFKEIVEDGGNAPDLALFGRMIADDPSYNVDAACQVAHAISTNRVAMDFDFFTAVDDLRPNDTAGSEMMGTVQFNSSCFYRYSVLDVADLKRNLGADPDLVRKTVAAYVRAAVQAIPSGKQNSMAAHNPPSFVLAVVRPKGTPVSLANAFTNPVRPSGDTDLIDGSVSALQKYLQSMAAMYGCAGISADYIADRDVVGAEGPLRLTRRSSLDALLEGIETQIDAGLQQ